MNTSLKVYNMYETSKYRAIINIRNRPTVTLEIETTDIRDVAEEIRRNHYDHRGFEIKKIT